MDKIKIEFSRTAPTPDGSSINYVFGIAFRSFGWEISKRFSEFDFLLEQLPLLPPKTAPLLNLDSNAILQRSAALAFLLDKLSIRPDVRNSSPFRAFIDFDAHTGIVVSSHELRLGRMNLDARFGVTGIAIFADALIAVHTDTTSLSRLGRVWSIVEPDELGSMSIWRVSTEHSLGPDASNLSDLSRSDVSKLGERLFIRLLPEKGNCMAMTKTGQVAVGMGNGHILLFDVQAPGVPIVTIPAHGVSPVVDIAVSSDSLLYSVAVDGTLRITSAVSFKVIAGGKLSRRFESGELATCIGQTDERIFIGSNKGRVIIYHFDGKLQITYLHTMSMSSYPVHDIHFTDQLMFVAFDSFVNAYELSQRGNEKHMVRTKFQIQATAQVHVIDHLHNGLIVAGLGDGSVAVYQETNLVYARYFSEEQINVLVPCTGSTIWVGADDGRIVECLIPASLLDDAEYVSEPVKQDIVPQLISLAPKTSQKSAALADIDSDDDDWKRGLFAS